MDSVTFFWAIAATVLGGCYTFTNKIIAVGKYDAAANTFLTYLITGCISAVGVVALGVPDNYLVGGMLAALSGFLYTIASMTRIKSLTYVDSTIFFPLYKIIQPLLIVFAGVFFLNENLSQLQYVGIAVGMLVPVMLIDSTEHHRQKSLSKGIELLLVTTVVTTLGTITAKVALPSPDSVLYYMCVAQLVGALSAYALMRKQQTAVKSIQGKELKIGIVSGLLQFCSLFALTMALSLGFVSLVVTIHAHYILIPIFLSVWFYKEHMNMRKFVAVVLSLVAIGLLY